MKKANPSKAILRLSERIKKAAAQLKDLRQQLSILRAEKKAQSNDQPVRKAAGKKSASKKRVVKKGRRSANIWS